MLRQQREHAGVLRTLYMQLHLLDICSARLAHNVGLYQNVNRIQEIGPIDSGTLVLLPRYCSGVTISHDVKPIKSFLRRVSIFV